LGQMRAICLSIVKLEMVSKTLKMFLIDGEAYSEADNKITRSMCFLSVWFIEYCQLMLYDASKGNLNLVSLLLSKYVRQLLQNLIFRVLNLDAALLSLSEKSDKTLSDYWSHLMKLFQLRHHRKVFDALDKSICYFNQMNFDYSLIQIVTGELHNEDQKTSFLSLKESIDGFAFNFDASFVNIGPLTVPCLGPRCHSNLENGEDRTNGLNTKTGTKMDVETPNIIEPNEIALNLDEYFPYDVIEQMRITSSLLQCSHCFSFSTTEKSLEWASIWKKYCICGGKWNILKSSKRA
jgi:hypothetical protein